MTKQFNRRHLGILIGLVAVLLTELSAWGLLERNEQIRSRHEQIRSRQHKLESFKQMDDKQFVVPPKPSTTRLLSA